MRTRIAMLAIAQLLLVGCGGADDKEAASPVGDGGGMPACSDVWVAGEILPEDYEGCAEGDSISAPVFRDCEDGSKFTSYDDEFYAKYGGEIIAVKGEMSDDPAYKAFFNACVG